MKLVLAMMTLLSSFLFSTHALAEDISLIQGLYRSQDIDDGVSSSEITLGARYGLLTEDRKQWFVQASLTQTSYSGDNAPEGTQSISLGGGRKYFFSRLHKRLIPYLSWVALINSTEPDAVTEVFGIFYSGQFGLRLALSKAFHIELESQFFQSELTSTTEVTNADGSKTKTSRTELFIDSVGSFDSTLVSLVYRFDE
ncbi:hypothetical protein [Pseudobacteriovorax antillogorgiicola]|uniref:Outer membrane protein beta-barrel domain-containing protein n=1 Tax=Pseudobacteriovorax antillogorgiicola TaxID=1513793 RepID=A0A1Y6CLB7_9BACT|nr:hypothetical protein [Pseudobacteriovorax antillogorgiicola]TCS45413.1 hypothetical protein EDD56_12824 [Pseudobacteriovorax antillogorgiicola]SMF74029.1 hypothetical protein SAMN06296036_12824 [Pseudobacteriovorax antillogorgiicola]